MQIRLLSRNFTIRGLEKREKCDVGILNLLWKDSVSVRGEISVGAPAPRYCRTSRSLLRRGLVVRELVNGDFVLGVFVAEAVLAYGFVNVDAGFGVECGV